MWLSWHQWLAKGCVLRACFKLIFLFLCFMESGIVHLHVYLTFFSCWESLMSSLHRLAVRQVCTRAYQGLAWLFPGLYFVTPWWASVLPLKVAIWGLLICCSSFFIYYWSFDYSGHVTTGKGALPLFQSKWGISSSELWVLHALAYVEKCCYSQANMPQALLFSPAIQQFFMSDFIVFSPYCMTP